METKTQCKFCTLPITRASPKANNKKFCTPECRKAYTLEHPSTAPSHTKEARDAYNHARWNKQAPGKTQCDDCGGWYYGIAYHTTQRHGVSADDYKAMHGLNRGLGLIPEATKERKAQATRENGTIENLKKARTRDMSKATRRQDAMNADRRRSKCCASTISNEHRRRKRSINHNSRERQIKK